MYNITCSGMRPVLTAGGHGTLEFVLYVFKCLYRQVVAPLML